MMKPALFASLLLLLPMHLAAQRLTVDRSGVNDRNLLYFEAFKSGPDILFNWAVNSNSEVSQFLLTQGVMSEDGSISWEEVAVIDKNSLERNTEYYYLHKGAMLGQMIYRIREKHLAENKTMAPIYKSKFF